MTPTYNFSMMSSFYFWSIIPEHFNESCNKFCVQGNVKSIYFVPVFGSCYKGLRYGVHVTKY